MPITESQRAASKKWRDGLSEDGRKHRADTMRKWKWDNAEDVKAYHKAYMAANKERMKEQNRNKVCPPGKPDTKTCRDCGSTKLFTSEFFPNRLSNKYLLDHRCKKCANIRGRLLGDAKKYGIPKDKVLVMRAAPCAICGERSLRSMHIDHCHKTGVVRATLCPPCNKGLGLFREDPKKLRAAAAYIESMSK
jgi:recombination endonuclease VII